MNRDEDRNRYDVWANYGLTRDDEANLGIMNPKGLPNNPLYDTISFFKKYYENELELYKTYKFKHPQHRAWAESLSKGTYVSKI